MNKAIEYIEQQLASRIHDAKITVSAVKFFEIINKAKELDTENDFEYDADINDMQNF